MLEDTCFVKPAKKNKPPIKMLQSNGQPTSVNSITVIITANGNEVAISKVYGEDITPSNIADVIKDIEKVVKTNRQLFPKKVIQ